MLGQLKISHLLSYFGGQSQHANVLQQLLPAHDLPSHVRGEVETVSAQQELVLPSWQDIWTEKNRSPVQELRGREAQQAAEIRAQGAQPPRHQGAHP